MLKQLKLGTSLRSISDLVFPRVCVVCGCELGLDEEIICLDCLLDLPQTKFALLRHNPMSDRLNGITTRLYPDKYQSFTLATALFYYRSRPEGIRDYGNISKDLKYRRNFPSGRFFGHKLALELKASPLYSDLDMIIPVPLHWTRRLKRGYNQASILANEIAQTMGVSCEETALIRRHHTKQQTRLGVQAKFQNVNSAFRVNLRSIDKLLSANHILVVDDIFTTGATLSACVLVLREFVPDKIKISVATLGYVGEL